MNKLSIEARAQIIKALVEGNSIRSTCRQTGAAKGTVTRLLVEVGEAASRYQNDVLRNLPCTRIEADEIWSFVGAKEANKTQNGQGDLWTFTAICADTKLAVTWLCGPRDTNSTHAFMRDLASRLGNRVQLSTDALRFYAHAVEGAFGWNGCDFAQIIKKFGGAVENKRGVGRYSPSPVVVGVDKVAIMGNPNPKLISTSYVERSNLSMRMQMRRFTRLTNGFSKKAENHVHAVSLHFMWYNFARPHGTLPKKAGGIHTTPAMAAGLTDRVCDAETLLHTLLTYAK
jgi:IS1 family transposase